ncbi:MAG: hypothetical protein IMZ66_08520, partial [Planctomycetes bacterium]|nr:hypothetical protein [Planctomycetota bacterium]
LYVEKTALEGDMRRLRGDNAELQAKFANLTKRVAEVKALLDDRDATEPKLKKEIETLRREKELLLTEIVQKTAFLGEAKHNLEAQRVENADLRRSLGETKNWLTDE